MKIRRLWPIFAALPMTAANAAGSSGISTITNVNLDTYNQFAVFTGATTWNNPDNCSASAVVVLPFSNQYYKDVLAAVLMASATGKTVSFWLGGCTWTPWATSQPVVLSVSVN